MHIIDRTGEINYNSQGIKMWIKSYRKYEDIDVEFEDGFVKYNTHYGSFKNGKIKNNNYKIKTNTAMTNRLNEINISKYGSLMKIIKYNNYDDILVEFQDEYKATVKTRYTSFREGLLINPYNRTVYGVGYLGVGKYTVRDSLRNLSRIYSTWYDMISRCYSKHMLEKNPTYKGCTVNSEWHNFQNFGQWYDKNYYKVENHKMHLDKDILFKGNKIYSSDTCIFVPHRINSLFVKADKLRKDLPIGVSFNTSRNKYFAGVSIIDHLGKVKSIKLGRFNTPEEAFYKYKDFKESYIKQVAEEYKDKIPRQLYDAMCRYEVEITD